MHIGDFMSESSVSRIYHIFLYSAVLCQIRTLGMYICIINVYSRKKENRVREYTF